MMNVLEIKNLKKYFGTVKAVDDVSFKVKKGELFAFLGLNGAGKSTTINIICGSLIKDDGEVFVCGERIESDESYKTKLGVVHQSSVLDKALTVKDNLSLRANLYGICGDDLSKRLNELDNLLGLEEILNRPVGKLSGGQKRRADIARAIIHKPEILILDEPTTGLDPQTRKRVWGVIEKLRREDGVTIFLTTHYMEEASGADYLVVLDSGKVSAEGTPYELKNKYTGDFLTIYNTTEEKVKLLNYPYEKVANGYKIKLSSTKEATRLIIANPELFEDYEIVKGDMDDVFLACTGKNLVGGEANENIK